jgi:hypothetical protein
MDAVSFISLLQKGKLEWVRAEGEGVIISKYLLFHVLKSWQYLQEDFTRPNPSEMSSSTWNQVSFWQTLVIEWKTGDVDSNQDM